MTNFIGEISSNHNQNLKRCFKFIDLCSDLKFYAVKFQLFKIDKLFTSNVLKKYKSHRQRKKWELPLKFIPKISRYCKKKNIKFGCTPFYVEAVEELKPYVDFYKISSYEILRKELIMQCAKTNKPVIISTGMASLNEVQKAVKILKDSGCKKITVLHCVSSYPAKIIDCNLNSINYLSKKLKYEIGWSDHTRNPLIINEVISKFNVKFIELHIDLEGKGYEFDQGHCWLPKELKELTNFISNKPKIYGKNTKKFSNSEKKERLWRADPLDGLRPIKRIRNRIK